MFDWKAEDLALMNESKTYIGKNRRYNAESRLTRAEKIEFVDRMNDGLLSYYLELLEKYNEALPTLPKDQYGSVKTVSLKAWLNRNDTRKQVDAEGNYGQIYFKGHGRYIQYGFHSSYDIYEDFVDSVFHNVLCECELKEKKWFKEHDEYSILSKRVSDYVHQYRTTFGVNLSTGTSGVQIWDDNDNHRNYRPAAIDELEELLAKYEQIDALIEDISANTHITYNTKQPRKKEVEHNELDT